jgi:hypothetical protein
VSFILIIYIYIYIYIIIQIFTLIIIIKKKQSERTVTVQSNEKQEGDSVFIGWTFTFRHPKIAVRDYLRTEYLQVVKGRNATETREGERSNGSSKWKVTKCG